MNWLYALIPVAALAFLLIAGYVKAPPDTAYIISGFLKPRILIGRAGIRIPFLERMDKLSLKMFSVDVKTTDFVPNAEYMRILAEAYNTQEKQDFYEFMLALEALKASLTGEEKTIILDENSELGKILMGLIG